MLLRRKGITLAVLVAACSTGSSTAPTGDFTLATSAPAAATLGTTDSFQVTLHSTGGYAGQVLLTFPAGVPSDWIVDLSQNPVTLTAGGTASSTVRLTIPTNGTPAPAGDTVTVHASGVNASHSTTVAVTVANELVVPIVLGADSARYFGAFTTGTVHVNVGTTISVLNNDTASHIAHYNLTSLGLAHQNVGGGSTQGQKYSQVVTATGSDVLSSHGLVTKDSVHLASP